MNPKIPFELLTKTIKKLFILNGILLLMMSIFRFIFFIYFEDFSNFGSLYFYVLKAFVTGVRFDLVIIAYINILVTLSFIVIWLLQNEIFFKKWLTFLKYYYFIIYSLVFIVLYIDFGFYSYFQDHLNVLVFGLFEDDTKAVLSSIWDSYNVPLILAGLIFHCVFTYLVCRYFIHSIKINNTETKIYNLGYKFGFAFLLVSINFLTARGTLTVYPLGLENTDISPNLFINKLGLNGVFSLKEAIRFRAMEENKNYDLIREMGYENQIEKAFSDFLMIDQNELKKDSLCLSLVKKTKKSEVIEKIRPNIIFILMEGFGTDLIKYNSENFNVLGELKKHFDSDYVFYNFIASDIWTIGSLETLLLNIPKRPLSIAVSRSRYGTKPHPSGVAFPYKNSGYNTIYVYGGNIGWRNLVSFIPLQGFDSVEGEGFLNPDYPRNEWGIFDEFLFEYIFNKLSTQSDTKKENPKFIFALTTTNHTPYSLPSTYKPLSLITPNLYDKRLIVDMDVAEKRFLTYQYACKKLGEFITKIKNSEFSKNTIIAVTGDHNFLDVFSYNTPEDYIDRYCVPFYLYVPDKLKPDNIDLETFGSHKDIMPTLYNLSLSNQKYVSIGNDIFDKHSSHVAFNSEGMIIAKDKAVKYSIQENKVSYYYAWDTKSKRKLISVDGDSEHEKLVIYFKSALAVTEYLLRNPFGIAN